MVFMGKLRPARLSPLTAGIDAHILAASILVEFSFY
jgi:hypothetical protein